MPTDTSRLLAQWMRAANDLGLEIEGPFDLMLPPDVHIRAPVFVRCFGGPKGMLVLSDYSLVRNRTGEIVQAGYGYSVMDEPGADEEYAREVFIEVLTDWGWYGAKSERPAWLGSTGAGQAS